MHDTRDADVLPPVHTPPVIFPDRLIDPAAVEQAIRLIAADNVTELRALDACCAGDRYPGTWSGYFDDAGKLAEAASTIQSARGVYFVPNPVDRRLLGRAMNRLRRMGKGDSATSDGDIIARRWLLIDADPVRPAGISSSDAEHEAAIERIKTIADALQSRGWPRPIIADSGNGAHALYAIDLPVDDGGLAQRCLEAIANEYDDHFVKVDRKVYNASRIWKIYGTRSCKGDNTPDRPHRMAKLIEVPA